MFELSKGINKNWSNILIVWILKRINKNQNNIFISWNFYVFKLHEINNFKEFQFQFQWNNITNDTIVNCCELKTEKKIYERRIVTDDAKVMTQEKNLLDMTKSSYSFQRVSEKWLEFPGYEKKLFIFTFLSF